MLNLIKRCIILSILGTRGGRVVYDALVYSRDKYEKRGKTQEAVEVEMAMRNFGEYLVDNEYLSERMIKDIEANMERKVAQTRQRSWNDGFECGQEASREAFLEDIRKNFPAYANRLGFVQVPSPCDCEDCRENLEEDGAEEDDRPLKDPYADQEVGNTMAEEAQEADNASEEERTDAPAEEEEKK